MLVMASVNCIDEKHATIRENNLTFVSPRGPVAPECADAQPYHKGRMEEKEDEGQNL